MNNILKIMYELLNREERRKNILIINFTKEKIKNAGIEKYFALAICADESEYNKIKYNIKNEPNHKYFDKIVKFDSIEYNKFFNDMKFDLVIGNPPYEGKGNPLYLQILEKVNVNDAHVIWLCPTQWVKNYKDSKYLANLKNDTCNNLVFHTFIRKSI